MADAAAQLLRKTRKGALASDWIEKISKKHPDRPYFFNVNTNDKRWSPPLESDDKKNRKSKKRKTADLNEEDFSDASPSAAEKMLDAIINKPKLIATGVKASTNIVKESPNNDTPTMRLIRQKLNEKKKAALKLNGVKLDTEKQKLTATDTKKLERTQRGSSVSSSSTASASSVPSSTSSMGTKIKASATSAVSALNQNHNNDRQVDLTQASASSITTDSKATSAVKSLNQNDNNNVQEAEKKLPKIPKIFGNEHNKSSQANLSENEKLNDASDDNSSQNDVTVSSSRSAKRCPANERLKRLRKNLSNNKNKRFDKSQSLNNSDLIDSLLYKSKLKFSTPIIFKGCQKRLSSLESRTQNQGILNIKTKEETSPEENIANKKILESIKSPNLYCEEMEWEPIEEEKIISEIYLARNQLCEKSAETSNELSSNALKSINDGENNALYIVIDTNVYLSNLPFIEEVRDSRSTTHGRPFLVVPWTVLQELDFIKDDKNNTRSQSLQLKARKAIDFLNQHFTAKHPRILGQTRSESEANKEKFMFECPDDEILQTCLQIKESSKIPVLLSYDKNLCNKAMIHSITVLTKNDPLDKIFNLKVSETTQFLSNSIHSTNESKLDDDLIIQKELLAADDIMEEGKAVLKSVLSQVVAKEMEGLFGNRWELHVIHRPPWTVITVLKCALKHWIAAVSESFTRRAETILRDLQVCLTETPEDGRKLNDVKTFLNKCDDLIQTLNSTKYPEFKEKILSQINELKQRCLNSINEIKDMQFERSIGSVEDCEQEQRAEFGFKVLEDIYFLTRDICGVASDTLGLQCAFHYDNNRPFLTPEIALQEQKDIGCNLRNLLQMLRFCLSKDYQKFYPDKTILSLYDVIVNYSSILDFNNLSKLMPIDLYCCIKLKKEKLEQGYLQLQELALHFCRIANKLAEQA